MEEKKEWPVSDYLSAFNQKEDENFTLKVTAINGVTLPFVFKKSHLAFEQWAEEKKTSPDADRNLLLSTAVAPSAKDLQKIFAQDYTLPAILGIPYAEAIGLERKAFVKK